MTEIAAAMLLRLVRRGVIHPGMSILAVGAGAPIEVLREAGFRDVTGCSDDLVSGGAIPHGRDTFYLCIALQGVHSTPLPEQRRSELIRVERIASIITGSPVGLRRERTKGQAEIFDVATGATTASGGVVGDAVEMAWNPSTGHLAVGTDLGELSIFHLPLTDIFADGFESGDTSAWSATVP